MNLCVPPNGYADARITVDASSPIYGDMRNQDTIGQYRVGGILFTQITASGDLGPCKLP